MKKKCIIENVFYVGYKKIEIDLLIFIYNKLEKMDISQQVIDNITNAAVNVIQPNKNICIRCRTNIEDDNQLYELPNMFPRNIVFCKSCIDDCHDPDGKHDENFQALRKGIQDSIATLVVEASKKALANIIIKKAKAKKQEEENVAPVVVASEPVVTPEKVPKKGVNKRLQTLKEEYEKIKTQFTNGESNEIYDKMENIAKKKYFKDEECAAFQEEFYQDFIQNAVNWNANMYNEKHHEKLVKLRAKTAPTPK